MCRNVTNHLGVMLSESEASAFPKGYEKADSSAVPQNDVLTHSLMGEDEGEGDQQITPHPQILSGARSNLLPLEGEEILQGNIEWIKARVIE